MNWPALALLVLIGAAVMILRQTPLSPALWLAPLLLSPLLRFAAARRCWREWLAGTLLLVWMAFSLQQQWQQRLSQPQDLKALRGWVEAPLSQRGDARHFAWRVDQAEHPLHQQRLRLAWYRDAPELAPGQCWQLDLRARPPRGALNPGGMDYAGWLFREAYAGKGSVRAGSACGQRPPGLRQRLISNLDQALQSRVDSLRARATIRALLLGERSLMTAQDWEILRRTGTSHLFAISGLHLGLMAALGWSLGMLAWSAGLYRYLPRARDLALLGSAAAALAYAALSGFAVPVQRALIMCLLGLLALQSGRQLRPWSVLALAWLLVVALQPLSLLMPGLWLSFAAVAAIIAYLQRYPAQAGWRQLLGIQLLLSLLLLPLGLHFFAASSLLALPVNLLLVPAFTILLPGLLLTVVLAALGMAWPLSWAGIVLEALWSLLATLAAWPAGFWQAAALPWPWLALALLAAAAVVLLPGRRGLRAVALLGYALILLWPRAAVPAHGELEAWFFDVGQGQSVLLRTAGHTLLYDAGPAWSGGFDAGARVVVPALAQLGVRQLDGLIISHGDNDHAGGGDAVIDALAPRQHWGHGGEPCRAGVGWQWDGVRFSWLHPADAAMDNDNNRSCVLLVRTASGRRLLLSGDIEARVETQVLRRGLDPVDVLSVPHHGSASSSSAAWVSATRPQLAVVQAGYDNRWRHPRTEVLARYRAQGSEIWNTGERGALRVQLGDALRWQGWRDQQPRLWRFYAESSAVPAH